MDGATTPTSGTPARPVRRLRTAAGGGERCLPPPECRTALGRRVSHRTPAPDGTRRDGGSAQGGAPPSGTGEAERARPLGQAQPGRRRAPGPRSAAADRRQPQPSPRPAPPLRRAVPCSRYARTWRRGPGRWAPSRSSTSRSSSPDPPRRAAGPTGRVRSADRRRQGAPCRPWGAKARREQAQAREQLPPWQAWVVCGVARRSWSAAAAARGALRAPTRAPGWKQASARSGFAAEPARQERRPAVRQVATAVNRFPGLAPRNPPQSRQVVSPRIAIEPAPYRELEKSLRVFGDEASPAAGPQTAHLAPGGTTRQCQISSQAAHWKRALQSHRGPWKSLLTPTANSFARQELQCSSVVGAAYPVKGPATQNKVIPPRSPIIGFHKAYLKNRELLLLSTGEETRHSYCFWCGLCQTEWETGRSALLGHKPLYLTKTNTFPPKDAGRMCHFIIQGFWFGFNPGRVAQASQMSLLQQALTVVKYKEDNETYYMS